MRADAERRRAALIRQARHLFAKEGGDVALEAIADSAGVGIATLYRNFESRSVLAEHVVLAILADLDAATAKAATTLADDPERAWRTYVDALVALDLGAFTAALWPHLSTRRNGHLLDAQNRSLAAVDELLVAVREAGLAPADLSALEMVVAVGIVTRPQPETVRRAVPRLVDRLVDALVAGLQIQAQRTDDADTHADARARAHAHTER